MIDISKELYNMITHVSFGGAGENPPLIEAVVKGKVLPQKHGRLIDISKVEVLSLANVKRQYDKGFNAGVTSTVRRFLDAPTIIEATGDKKE